MTATGSRIAAGILACGLATGCAAAAEDDVRPDAPSPVIADPSPTVSDEDVPSSAPTRSATATSTPMPTATGTPTPTATPAPSEIAQAQARPEWLGTRPLEEGPGGISPARQTPEELVDRRLPPPSPAPLPPPETDEFSSEIRDVPAEVAARSTWSDECPVFLEQLRHVTVTFWGFDERPHTGELLVHADVAEDLVDVFARLYDARFPVEEMRIITDEELEAPPTGDGNVTTAFVCRPITGSSGWSQHAYGLAVDINPFHNPYERGDQVIPELATAYTDRGDARPGMITRGDVGTETFADIGWAWGGDWESLTDPMHFSASGL